MGDFNYPEINWESHHANTSDTHPAFLFLEAVNDCYLSQGRSIFRLFLLRSPGVLAF